MADALAVAGRRHGRRAAADRLRRRGRDGSSRGPRSRCGPTCASWRPTDGPAAIVAIDDTGRDVDAEWTRHRGRPLGMLDPVPGCIPAPSVRGRQGVSRRYPAGRDRLLDVLEHAGGAARRLDHRGDLLGHDPRGQLGEDPASSPVAEGHRLARVARRAAMSGCSGMLPTSGTPISSASRRPPPGAEEGVGGAVLAGEGAHVLDHAGHPEVPSRAMSAARAGHLLGGQGRRGDDEHLGARQHAGQAHLDVAGARGACR